MWDQHCCWTKYCLLIELILRWKRASLPPSALSTWLSCQLRKKGGENREGGPLQVVLQWPNPQTARAGTEERKRSMRHRWEQTQSSLFFVISVKSFFSPSWCILSVCFYTYLEKLPFFQLWLFIGGTSTGLEVLFQWDLGGGNDNYGTEGVLSHCEAYHLLGSCNIKKYPLDVVFLK